MNVPHYEDVLQNPRHFGKQSLVKYWKEFYDFLIQKYPGISNNIERMYLYYHNMDTYKTCPICGKRLSFITFEEGYKKYCSPKCANKDPGYIENRKKILKEKYGVEYPSQIPTSKEKIKKTCNERYGGMGFGSKKTKEKIEKTTIERYGYNQASSNEEIKEKIKHTQNERYGGMGMQSKDLKGKIYKTNLEKYGAENPMQSEELKERYTESILEKYGSTSPFGNKQVRKKSMQTKLERYGDEEYNNREKMEQTCQKLYGGIGLQSEELKEKAQKTNLKKYGAISPLGNKEIQGKNKKIWNENYGADNPFKSKEIQEKIKQTNINRYGVNNPFGSEIIQDKIKQTNIERYGGKNPMDSEEVKNKIKETNIKRYGVESTFQLDEVKEKIRQTNLERYGTEYPTVIPEIKEKIKQTNLKRYGVEYYTQTDEYVQKMYNTKKQNKTFSTSQIEESFTKWLKENNINFIRQYKDIDRYPFACDFYFPEKDVFLEIQGCWTHGGHPYDPNNEEDQKELQRMMDKNTVFYNNAIKVWVITDPLKRKTAKEHNLNWYEVFTTDLDTLINECKVLNIF